MAPRTLAYWATAERAAATGAGTAGHARFSGFCSPSGGRLDGAPRRSPAAPTQPNRGSVRLSRPQAALLDGPRALRGFGLPPATRFRRRPPGHRRHRHALPRLPRTGRPGRRDSSRPADDERPADAARGFGHWFTRSAFAPASRSAQKRRTAASRLGRSPPSGASRRDSGITSICSSATRRSLSGLATLRCGWPCSASPPGEAWLTPPQRRGQPGVMQEDQRRELREGGQKARAAVGAGPQTFDDYAAGAPRCRGRGER